MNELVFIERQEDGPNNHVVGLSWYGQTFELCR
jgi:hypothetical protein